MRANCRQFMGEFVFMGVKGGAVINKEPPKGSRSLCSPHVRGNDVVQPLRPRVSVVLL